MSILNLFGPLAALRGPAERTGGAGAEPSARHATPRNRRAALTGRSRSVVLWTVGFLVLLQTGFEYPVSHWFPRLHDPEYGHKFASLRWQLRSRPAGQPLVVVLGNSHTGMGIRPDTLPGDPASPDRPMVFNMSLNGAGPVLSLVVLKRLLAEGIRPDCVLVETWSLVLSLDGPAMAGNGAIALPRVRHGDLEVLERYYGDPAKLRADYALAKRNPWFNRREYLMNRFLPSWVPKDKRFTSHWDHTDNWGWQWVEGCTTQATPLRIEGVRLAYIDLFKGFKVSEAAERALRELAEVTQREGIELHFLRMPESASIRASYAPEVVAEVDRFFERMRADTGVGLIDAHAWVPDEALADGHHMNPPGAELFTARLNEEVLSKVRRGGPDPR